MGTGSRSSSSVTAHVLLLTIVWLHRHAVVNRFRCDGFVVRNSIVKPSRRVICWSGRAESDIPATYPLARRKLIEKAKAIDPALARGERTGSYSGTGWSNRLGTVLTPVAIPGVYVACRPFLFLNFDVSCRMTVVQLASGGLWIHSPVALDGPLIEALNDLGTVEHVVTPNYEHTSFVKQWADHYPNARIWACPGLPAKMPQVSWTDELPHHCRPSANEGPWQGEIQPLHLDYEHNPFTGNPFFNEVVFYHTPTHTLIATDLFWNYPTADGTTNKKLADLPGGSNTPGDDVDYGVWELAPKVQPVPILSRLFQFGMNKIYRPFYLNFMIKPDKKDDFRRIVRQMSGMSEDGWDVHTIVPAHGDVIRGNELCKRVLTDHLMI